MNIKDITDTDLLIAYREMLETEPNWNDYGGEIQAAEMDYVYAEMERRGLGWNVKEG